MRAKLARNAGVILTTLFLSPGILAGEKDVGARNEVLAGAVQVSATEELKGVYMKENSGVQVTYRRHLGRGWAAGFTAWHVNQSVDNPFFFNNRYRNPPEHIPVTTLTVTPEYHLHPGGKLDPYLRVGLQGLWSSCGSDEHVMVPTGLDIWDYMKYAPRSAGFEFGWYAGAGMTGSLKGRFIWNLEVGYSSCGIDARRDYWIPYTYPRRRLNSDLDLDYQPLSVSVSVGFRW